jgi:hypothetical protein
MGKYIIFKTETASDRGWEDRKLAHTGALTSILAEHYDFSNSDLPQVGYRLREYHQIDQFADKEFPGASTHSRMGDWEVIRVEEYSQNWSAKDLESVVICYCQYSPVETPLEPLPKVQTTEELMGTLQF